MNIRQVNPSDINDLFEWRNDSTTRKFSTNTRKINFSTHTVWFQNILKDKENKYYIGIKKGNKVGFVSYVKKGDRNLHVSININPEYRGHGFGSILLRQSQNKKEIRDKADILLAKVKNNNKASIETFKKAFYSNYKNINSYYIFRNQINSGKNVEMKKNIKKKKLKNIIDKIESIRSKNNVNWMQILRIAFEHSPKETENVMSKIYKEDQRISSLAKKLSE